MSLETINSKILRPATPMKKNTLLKKIFKISFDNKIMEKINPSRILHDPLIKAALSNTSANFDNLIAVCTLRNPIRSNFSTFINLFITLM